MMANLKKYEQTFCRQTKSLMIGLQKNLEILAKNPQNKQALKDCLLNFHTLKGSAGAMECKGLENFVIKAEKDIKNPNNILQLKSSCQEIESLAGDFRLLCRFAPRNDKS
ncbi:MAG: hypothetical protein UR98_C0022G0004 [Parcubacteria group bacterium GW2011_GWA1_36_12]|nr:MAG: hypothetical protein UR98_C0022G0004 [Parcubacteria group bacterium GW2011_GWA1_36_12]